tara:strand:+ start:263 stop:802 length:540 start_codon:yes stop_codon:yes gene_type:complete
MFIDKNRSKTRRERYNIKTKESIELPACIATINFDFDENLAFLIRSAACYGIKDILVIGSIPDRKLLFGKSGSLIDYVNMVSFSNPGEFIKHCRRNDINIVSVELTEDAFSIHDYRFDLQKKTAFVIGNESVGVPSDILHNSDTIYIPMLGNGYCLNASQAGTAVMHEYCRQFIESNNI